MELASPIFHYDKTLAESFFSVDDPEYAEFLKLDQVVDPLSLTPEEMVMRDSLLAGIDLVESHLWYDINQYQITQYCSQFNNTIGFARMRPNFSESISIGYYDTANALQVLDPSNYIVVRTFLPYIKLLNKPSHYDREDAFVVTYHTGFDSAAVIPAKLKNICYRMAAYLHECRVDERKASDSFVEQICIGLREFRF